MGIIPLTLLAVFNISLYFAWVFFTADLGATFRIFSFITNFFLSLILFYNCRNELRKFWSKVLFYKIFSRVLNIFLVFSALGLVNYIIFKFPKFVDFTKEKTHSLTEQTRNVLKQMNGPIQVIIAGEKDQFESMRAMIQLYRFEKNDIELDYLDMARRPDLVQQMQLDKSSSFVIKFQGRQQVVSDLTELAITNALIKLSHPKSISVGIIIGHKELDFNSNQKDGLAIFKKMLELQDYQLQFIPLAEVNSIPPGLKNIILWGPKSGFLPQEINVLRNYLEQQKGNMIVALDPQMGTDHLQNLRQMLNQFGIDIKNNLVVDSLSHVNGSTGSIPIIKKFSKNNPITKSFEGQVFFPFVSMVVANEKWVKKGGTVDFLAQTSAYPASWAESDMKEVASGKVQFKENVDSKGPVAVAASFQLKNQKILVFGNSSFVLNAYSNMTDNFKLLSNGISWASDENSLISFDLSFAKESAVVLNSFQLTSVFYFSAIFLPLCLLGLAFAVYRYKLRA